MSYAQWRKSYNLIFFTYVSLLFFNCSFIQVCLVEIGRCIFSVYMYSSFGIV
jgi:hypothetical protein